MHGQVRKLSEEARNYRIRRDELNAKVKQLKLKLQEIRGVIRGKKAFCMELKSEVIRLRELTPTTGEAAKKTYEDLEWKIQTTPLKPAEERVLVEQVGELEKQLAIHRKADTKMRELEEERLKIEALRTDVDRIFDELKKTVDESRQSHEKANEFFRAIDKLKEEADAHHQKFTELKSKADEVHKKLVEILNQRKMLEKQLEEVGKEMEVGRMKKAMEVREQMRKVAEEKLKRRAKLTFEEFKLLIGEKEES